MAAHAAPVARRRVPRIRAPRRGAGLLVGALMAGFIAISVQTACAGVDLDGMSDAQVQSMLDAGWVGSPTDGREALYPVSCAP